jgi:doublecortin-like kinase 1/2
VVSNNNNSTGRISLQKLSSEKKAKRVKFYRNGDKYFKGVSYSIMNEKFRNFDSLLDDLNNVLIDQVCTVSSSIS